MTSNPNPANAGWGRDLAALLACFGALFFFALGRAPLDPKDEGRYAEIPREMIAAGDYVTPRLDGVTYFEKPPLMYWAVAACERVFGPGEASVRAPAAGFALFGVLLTYAAARRLFGRAAGLASAAALGTSAFYGAYSHILSLDLAVAVLISATLFCFILAVREPPGGRRRLLFYGLYAASALATLAKGPIGFLLTGAVMFLWLVVCGQWGRLRPLYLPSGAVLFLAVAAPWHLLAAARNPAWAHFYFVHENWERFTTTEHGRVGPWYYFIPEIVPGCFPWFGFLWAAGARALRGGWKARRENADRWFFVLWAAFIFLFFSKSQSKLPGYILPVYPALAVLLGAWLAELWRGGAEAVRRARVGFALAAGFGCLLAAAALVAVTLPGKFRIEPWQAEALRRYAWALAGGLVAGSVAVWRLARRGEARSALAALALTGAFLLGAATLAEPWLLKPGTKALALTVAERARPGDRVFHYGEFFHDFTFYARRPVDTVDYVGELEPQNDPAVPPGRFASGADFRRAWAGPGRVFAVARKRDTAELFADPSFHYHLLGQTPAHYLFSNRP